MAPIDFYYVPRSSMCNAISMVAKAVGVELNLILTELKNGDHLKPEFIKINPQHTIPTINDNGFGLWETRAIITYLVEKYGKDDSLYPKDPQKRAVVNQRLYFDLGTLYKGFADYYYPQFLQNKPGDPEMYKKAQDAMAFLNLFLEGNKFVAGDYLSVADFQIITTVMAYEMGRFDLEAYPNVKRWYATLKAQLPGFEQSHKNMQEMAAMFKH